MIRVYFILVILIFSAKTNAQTKVAYIDYSLLMYEWPEYKKAEKAYFNYVKNVLFAAYDSDVSALKRAKEDFIRDSVSKKNAALLDAERLNIQSIQYRIDFFQEGILESCQMQRDKLFPPLEAKANAAISAVVKENGYDKVVDKPELKNNPGAKDIMALVKKKMGIN